ncbi:MAG: dihydroneopterin aldolase [Sphingobacteriales bacterium]|nr:dihydroneopterin aldolase [Sphingobacteriales bacterium]
MLTIGLKGIKIKAPVGVYGWEKMQGRKYNIYIELHLNMDAGAMKDSLSNTVNYEDVYELVIRESEHPLNLVESFSALIGQRILENFQSVEKVKIRIEKERPLPRANLEAVFIESEFVRK